MPSKFLLDLYVQEDGTLDPRYHKFFKPLGHVIKIRGRRGVNPKQSCLKKYRIS